MKRKILFTFAIFALFSLAFAAFAVNQNSTTTAAEPASCCKDKDECPMKSKMNHGDKHMDHETKGEHAHADGKNCCGDSCPMKKDATAVSAADSAEKCCDCACCGDSCPMKKKEGATAVSASSEDKSCCDNCDCCSGKKDAGTEV
jgi:hypothetical protein